MSGVCTHNCGSCGNYGWFAVDYGEYPEDDCGSCKVTGEVVYSDDEACDEWFFSGKTMKPKENKKNKSKPKKMKNRNDDSWDQLFISINVKRVSKNHPLCLWKSQV